MDKTKIEWCDSTWNPVTGCKQGCPYCYARGMAERFGGYDFNGRVTTHNPLPRAELHDPLSVIRGDGKTVNAPYPFGFTPTLYRYRLNDYASKKGRTIFVCSMADLFGAWVPDSWIEEVFTACRKAPQHRYLFLTKNPKRYRDLEDAGKLPVKENMWYGTSVTNMEQIGQAADAFGELPGKTKTFFSVEPLLENIAASKGWAAANNGSYAEWIILGAETGRRKETVVPEREWVEKIVADCDEGGIPLFMKDSLIPVVGEKNMRRELPWNKAGGGKL